ncbi:MAG: 50S ribosomal protein L15 [Patescibacteria group bacterium]|nr:50S ribosomal protein L15 [Patescibacteria group bacterium]
MIELNKLSKIAKRGKKRLGQGHGSGRGKTAGRGTKGQKARGKMSMTFSAGNLSLVKRLPLIRGKLRNQSILKKKLPVNVKFLNFLPENSEVDLDFLIKNHIVKEDVKETGVKILGDGELKIALTVKLPCSIGARKKIEKAGGKVEN